MIYAVQAAAWVSTAIAVVAGIQATGKWALLFFMLIPAVVCSPKETKDDDKK